MQFIQSVILDLEKYIKKLHGSVQLNIDYKLYSEFFIFDVTCQSIYLQPLKIHV